MSSFPKHEAVVAWAEAEAAKGVKEVPLGSNTGPRVKWYQAHTWLPGTGWPWCAAFVCSAWQEGAHRPLPWPSAGAFDMGNRARKSGWTVSSIGLLVPGDIVVWNIGAGHVSLFLSYDVKTKLVRTVDGNVGNRADPRERPLSLARNLIHVPEQLQPVPPKLTRPGLFEVVSSETEKVIYVSGARAIGRHLGLILGRHPEGVLIRRKKASR